MMVIRIVLACFTAIIFCTLIMACLSFALDKGLSLEYYGLAAVVGLITGASSFRQVSASISLTSLSTMTLCTLLAFFIMGHWWPEMPYEQALGYLSYAGLAGMVAGALVFLTVRKARLRRVR
ncbi:hypothetical protein [Pseudomonas triticifolii]|uniref:Uncharacterized protein n=1 Tax=Pseudomonas triticifolii TaxID=2762592 RepID=A0ABR7BES0_9PSED|nr:hypothetical protein [Pseudomonas triticifolii]MBC3955671.1 hypothetical protein [Pseudomonas triticifolii]